MFHAVWLLGVLLGAALGCSCSDSTSTRGQGRSEVSETELRAASAGSGSGAAGASRRVHAAASNPGRRESGPQELYVPGTSEFQFAVPTVAVEPVTSRCPPEMVDVQERFCIDRFEASLVDARLSRPLSPFFFPSRERTRSAYDGWQSLRTSLGAPEFRILPIPEPPEFQFREEFEPLARSVRGVTPNGYLSGNAAESACRRAGKRLCNEKEWVFACRGERDTNFPYGESYSAGKCNVKNAKHPARLLHGDASKGHLDPRLNHFQHEGSPLLHETGSHLECASRWGKDRIYDMVGNLDEWVDAPDGAFLGGFYSRNTEAGCAAKVTVHPPAYYDYSLGTRCCR